MIRNALSILFLFVLIGTISAQEHLPTFKSITVSPKVLRNNDTLEATVVAYDSIFGIRSPAFSIYKPTGEFLTQVSANEYIGNNTYKSRYPITQWAISGVYKVGDIVIINNADKIFYNLTLLDSFTVISSTPDSTAPSFKLTGIRSKNLNISDTLIYEFEAYDAVSGLNFLWFNLYNPRNEVSNYDIRYFNNIQSLGNHRYVMKKVIPEGAIKGNWHVEIAIYDNADNARYFIDTSKIFVNGIYQDITPPVINSVLAYPDTIDLLDSANVIIDAEDPESGLKEMFLNLVDEQDHSESFHFYFNSPKIQNIGINKYLVSMEISRWLQKGNRSIDIYLNDNADNLASYVGTSKIYITDHLDSTKLGVDKLINNHVTIYPNPFDDLVNIRSIDNFHNKVLLKIYDTIGSLVYEQEISSDYPIDLSHFPKGTYCFVVISDKYTISRLVIKK
jgi:hypothetical protein